MIRHCAEPRCPVRIDSRDGPWYYCDEHRTEDKEADHAHDYATSMIEASRERADEVIRFLETVTDERHPALQDLAQTQLHEVRCLEDALYFEPSGTVAMYALLVGSRHMRIEAYLTEKGLHGRIEEMAPHARRGSTVIGGASKAGKQRVKKLRAGSPSDERLCAYVTAVHTENPDKSWNWVCDEAARRCNQLMESKGSPYRLVGRTMQRLAKAADWRRR
jgi:hypothetical protein